MTERKCSGSRAFALVLAPALALGLTLGAGCKGSNDQQATTQAEEAPQPVQQALEGPPRPGLLLTQAWFWTDTKGAPHPGPARLDIWREGKNGKSGWTRTRLEDGDSNVFHKAIAYDGGILTIGAERAILKKWTFKNGKWHGENLWERSWGGKFDRLRDMEIGDVDGDGKDEIVIATHDSGVVAVIDLPEDGKPLHATELDKKPDTFVHEIEIGDIDGDGKLEFFATPSDRNRANESQSGGVVMYKWDGKHYNRTWVEVQKGTHAKEILTDDIDGDGKDELFAVLEAEIDPSDKTRILKPVEIRSYTLGADGKFTHHVVATIDDRQTRFLVPGDFDGDGTDELVAGAFKTGLYHITPPTKAEIEAAKAAGGEPARWHVKNFERNSSGFEHAIYPADLDGDGHLELYVASDDQHELRRYDYDGGKWRKTVLGKLDNDVLTFNITAGTF